MSNESNDTKLFWVYSRRRLEQQTSGLEPLRSTKALIVKTSNKNKTSGVKPFTESVTSFDQMLQISDKLQKDL